MEINLGVMENGQRSKEAVQLLQDGHDTSSSDVHYHYQLPPPQTSFAGRKKVYRKHRRKSPSGSVSSSGETSSRPGKPGNAHGITCFPRMSKFVNWLLAFAIFIGASTLFWVIYGLRQDLVTLERRVHDVESGSQKVPNQLHEYHTKLKSVTENQTALVNEVLKMSEKMSELTAQLTTLGASVTKLEKGLMKSGTDDLLSLPEDVTKMQSTMATFGSQLRDVTSGLSIVHNASTAIKSRIDSCEARISTVETQLKAAPDTSRLESMNKTLDFVVEDLHGHHQDIAALKASSKAIPLLESSVKNLTAIVDSISESLVNASQSVAALDDRLLLCCDQASPQNDTSKP